jgi:hypothetical protein
MMLSMLTIIYLPQLWRRASQVFYHWQRIKPVTIQGLLE